MASRIALSALLCAIVSAAAIADEPLRFEIRSRQAGEPAEWISLDGIRVAYGSDRRVVVARTRHGVVESRITLDTVARDGVLFGDLLYLADGDGELAVADLDSPSSRSRPLRVGFRPEGELSLGRMDEHLLVLENGVGLHVLELPPPAAHAAHEPARGAEDVRRIATLEIPGNLTAVAGSARKIFVSTDDGDLIVADAREPSDPRILHTIALGLEVDALAANGPRVYALHEGGLAVVNLDAEENDVIEGLFPTVRGRGIEVAGRAIHVASEELVSYMDQALPGAVHAVTVSSNVFTPSNLNVAVGDTVEWTNVAGFHNVESCDGVADPAQCSGVATSGLFRSGNPALPPWTFPFTFNVAGVNPYFCDVHVAFGMVGMITVTAPAAPPPGTPDGSGATQPVEAAKAPVGIFPNRLAISWDAATCTDAQDYQLLFGDRADLPSSFSGTYSLGGGVCSIGTSGGFNWNNPPTPLPGDFAWFLIIANDGASEEGSWGRNSGNLERVGPGPGGASVLCNGTKDVSNGCGQ